MPETKNRRGWNENQELYFLLFHVFAKFGLQTAFFSMLAKKNEKGKYHIRESLNKPSRYQNQAFFPHESRSVTARLNTGFPGFVSLRSATK